MRRSARDTRNGAQSLHDRVPARPELRDHSIHLGRTCRQRGRARALHEGRGAGDRVRHELRHRIDERLWKDPVAETPSGHREGLAEAIEKDRPLGHALLACDRTMLAVVDQLAIDLVGEHPEVALARDPCDLADRVD